MSGIRVGHIRRKAVVRQRSERSEDLGNAGAIIGPPVNKQIQMGGERVFGMRGSIRKLVPQG